MNYNVNLLNIFDNRINLLDLNPYDMNIFLISIGGKKFSTQQIMRWIYHHNCTDFTQMSNLNKEFRQKLQEKSYISLPKFVNETVSCDGTIKWIMSFGNDSIETVYIPEKKRSTLCISSQIGCILKCHFCATGQSGFQRNLKVSEIIAQILQANQTLKKKNIHKKITNIVFMGMGEPLLNLKNVVSALKIIIDTNGFGLSKRRITLSTSGIVPALNKLIDIMDVCLAVSLHASNDKIRNIIMPINQKYNISSLLDAIAQYIKKSRVNHGGVTIEYVMLNNINDSKKNAEELAFILRNIPSKINLIPWNPFPQSFFRCSNVNTINLFANILRNKGFTTIIRKNRGQDINAACGQLTGEQSCNKNNLLDNHIKYNNILLKKV